MPSTGCPPYPAIIGYSGVAPLDTTVIDSEGVATINFNPLTVGAEGGGHSANQTGAFYSLYTGGSQTGLLVAWAWGVSRIIDVIAQSDGSLLRADAIGVTGCSRFGKGAFIAGAFDQRIALTLPVESGTAGVPVWRGIAKGEVGANGNPSQSLLNAYQEQPWFADGFSPFTGDPTTNPIDTHEIVAMIAPRGLFIMDNPFIGELSPQYGYLAAVAAAEVYTALGQPVQHRLRLGHLERRPLRDAAGVVGAAQEQHREVPDPHRAPGRVDRRQRRPAGAAGGLAHLDDADAELTADAAHGAEGQIVHPDVGGRAAEALVAEHEVDEDAVQPVGGVLEGAVLPFGSRR